MNQDISLSIWDQYIRTFRTYSKKVNFFLETVDNPHFFEAKTNAVENLQDLLKIKDDVSKKKVLNLLISGCDFIFKLKMAATRIPIHL